MLTSQLIYIDPGSGSLLFQMILSGLLTVMVFFKRITSYIRFMLSGKQNKDPFSGSEKSQ